MGVQCANTVVMVKPTAFRKNEETVESNAFQADLDLSSEDITRRVLSEFEGMVKGLREHDVHVIVLDNKPDSDTPDAVFPNNWFSTHPDGDIILYPMEPENRRPERRSDIAEILVRDYGKYCFEVFDLSINEYYDRFLEGTGSIVFDHMDRKGYACLSSRTDEDLLQDVCAYLDYEAVTFDSLDRKGNAIYHTNVMMSVGESWAVLCKESIPKEQAEAVEDALIASGNRLLLITMTQMENFCGNILEVATVKGDKLVVMSQRAWDHFDEEQKEFFHSNGNVLTVNLEVIEKLGGGGARCMMAEIFLPTEKDFLEEE